MKFYFDTRENTAADVDLSRLLKEGHRRITVQEEPQIGKTPKQTQLSFNILQQGGYVLFCSTMSQKSHKSKTNEEVMNGIMHLAKNAGGLTTEMFGRIKIVNNPNLIKEHEKEDSIILHDTRNGRPLLLLLDESDYGQHDQQVVAKLLTKFGVNPASKKDLEELNIFFVTFSATAFNEATRFIGFTVNNGVRINPEDGSVFYTPPRPSNYWGIPEMYKNEQIKQLPEKHPDRIAILDSVAVSPGYILFRHFTNKGGRGVKSSNKDLALYNEIVDKSKKIGATVIRLDMNTRWISELKKPENSWINDAAVDYFISQELIPPDKAAIIKWLEEKPDMIFSLKPKKLIVVIITGFFRRGDFLKKNYIKLVIDSVSNEKLDTCVQSLVGRMCGFEKHNIIIYTQLNLVKEYVNYLKTFKLTDYSASCLNVKNKEGCKKESAELIIPLTMREKYLKLKDNHNIRSWFIEDVKNYLHEKKKYLVREGNDLSAFEQKILLNFSSKKLTSGKFLKIRYTNSENCISEAYKYIDENPNCSPEEIPCRGYDKPLLATDPDEVMLIRLDLCNQDKTIGTGRCVISVISKQKSCAITTTAKPTAYYHKETKHIEFSPII